MIVGQHHTEETKAKMSAVLMGNTRNLGHHASEETRKKISTAGMGRQGWNKGIPMTEEAKAKDSAACKGKLRSEETCARISAAKKGCKASPETRAKQSIARMGKSPWNKGILMSEEVCLLNRLGHLGLHNKQGSLSKLWKGGGAVSGAKHSAKRRLLGFNPLNSPFPGCEGHHINPIDVIHMPRKLHRSIYHNQRTGKGMAEMNALAGAISD